MDLALKDFKENYEGDENGVFDENGNGYFAVFKDVVKVKEDFSNDSMNVDFYSIIHRI